MAKEKASLPASYGGLMRYGESIGKLQLEPGHVIVLVAAISVFLLVMNILG